MTETPLRALIYSRVSEDRSGGRSVEEQEAEARSVCEREGWEIVEVVADNSIGASRHSKGHRHGWDRARDLIREGQVDVLVTWEASRAQRDLAAYAELRDLCARTGTRWSFKGRTHDLTKSSDRFSTGLEAILAEREADETSERVRRAMRASAAKGRPPGRRLFGYERTYDQTSGQLTGQRPHPTEAPVVRSIFSDYLAGVPVSTIVNTLNDAGITTSTGVAWVPSQIHRVLRNPMYAARRVFRGEVVGPGDWEPLIAPEDFDRVEARRWQQNRNKTRVTGPGRLLTPVLRCGKCGARMFGGHDRNKRRSYYCRAGFCVARDETKLDAYVTAVLLEWLQRQDIEEALSGSPDPAVAAARETLDAIQQQLDDAISEFTAGNITAATLGRIEASLDASAADARAKLRRAVVPIDIAIPTDGIGDWWDALEVAVRREIVRAVFDSIVVKPAKRGSRTFDPDAVELNFRTA